MASPPPVEAAVLAERETANMQLKRARCWCAVWAIGLLLWFGLYIENGLNDSVLPPFGPLLTMGHCYAFLLGLVVSGKSVGKLLRTLDLLGNINRNHCPAVLAWCNQDPALAAYQAAVAVQGRVLTEGEYVAMQRWVRSADARAAFEALRAPVAQH